MCRRFLQILIKRCEDTEIIIGLEHAALSCMCIKYDRCGQERWQARFLCIVQAMIFLYYHASKYRENLIGPLSILNTCTCVRTCLKINTVQNVHIHDIVKFIHTLAFFIDPVPPFAWGLSASECPWTCLLPTVDVFVRSYELVKMYQREPLWCYREESRNSCTALMWTLCLDRYIDVS